MRLGAFGRKTLYMAGSRGSALDQARGRLVLISAVFVFAYLIVAARLVDVSVIQAALQRGEETFSFEQSAKADVAKRRSDIVDRNGILLARSLTTASLYADPALISDAPKLARVLSKVFPELSYGDILKKIQGNGRFVWIKRNLTPEEQQKILYLGDPALAFQNEDRRLYPQGELGAHMVGYSGIDGQGLGGVEGAFDKLLSHSNAPLMLTLDVRLQHAMRREIAATVKKFKAQGGAGIIMDAHSGEVLASVSYPDFDPHQVPGPNDKRLFNRTTLGVYELGSTFKIFSTAAVLDKKNIPLSRQFDARTPLEVGRFKINDYHAENRYLSVPEIFMHSSNIGSALMGQMVGTKALKQFYSDLGLFNASPIEVAEVSKPLIPDPWREVHTVTASYGHGIAVSPMQMVAATASIINGGVLVQPTLIHDQSAHRDNKKLVRVVSPETAHRMRQLMRLVVADGTGGKAEVVGYDVGGKTGTAEKPGSGGYNKKRLISSFVGAFPMHAPKYVVFIMVDEPQGIKETYGYATGGWVAAPAVGNVIRSMTSILAIKPSGQNEELIAPLRRYVKTKEQIKHEREAHYVPVSAH